MRSYGAELARPSLCSTAAFLCFSLGGGRLDVIMPTSAHTRGEGRIFVPDDPPAGMLAAHSGKARSGKPNGVPTDNRAAGSTGRWSVLRCK